jgi:hypothetical protein
MTRLMVRYKVRPEEVAANEQAIEGVFAELWERGLPGIRYATFKLEDGVSTSSPLKAMVTAQHCERCRHSRRFPRECARGVRSSLS